ncbi:MAG: transposase [Candidatus Gastranaerophilales bacterium]|nr:transposase [Candidatus Gastranaerophilales bacterium]
MFLEYLSQENSDYFIIMQIDGAGWHKSKGLKIPENMKLVFQPPYSPQANPTEHIWDEIRENNMKNITFKTLNDVINTLCDELNELRANVERVKSMTLFLHINIAL